MERIANGFISFVRAFRESPISFIMLTLLIVSAVIVYNNTEAIVDHFPTPKEESLRFESTLKRDLIINQALEANVLKLGAQGMLISQFHNGQHDLTRLPFTKVSVTYFVSSVETDDVFEARPISSMNRIMTDMWANKNSPQCISKPSATLRDSAYRQRVMRTGAVHVVLCPLTNVLDYPIGYVGVGFEREISGEEEEKIIINQRELAQRVAGYLQDGQI